MRKIKKILREVFGTDWHHEVRWNGTRAEGCSFLFFDDVDSWSIRKLMQRLNEELPELWASPLTEWRVRQEGEAMEVRLKGGEGDE